MKALERPVELDAQIALVEQRLIDRERVLRENLGRLRARASSALQPRRMVLPAAAAGAAAVGLWWWARGGAAGLATARREATTERSAAGRPAPWVHWLALGWPLLPQRWRQRISPTTAATIVSIGMPLAEKLLRPARLPALQTMARVDLARYAGVWHEIARLPAPFEAVCDGQPTAEYRPRGLRTIEVINRCPDGGRQVEARGVARVVPGTGNAKLRVSLFPRWARWLPFAWADYWIVHVDPAYRFAVVGHPNRRFLWLLSRSPSIGAARYEELVRIAAEQGFAVERLKVVAPPRWN